MRLATSLVVLLLATAGCASKSGLPPERDLRGVWLYDYQASDEARMKLQEAAGGALPVEDDPKSTKADQLRDLLHGLVDAPEIIDVQLRGNKLEMVGGRGFQRVFLLEGDSVRAARGLNAKWIGNRLVVGAITPNGTIEEAFEVAPGGRRMFVTLTIGHPALVNTLVVRRVYQKD